jgi:isocitrate dehydrogenase
VARTVLDVVIIRENEEDLYAAIEHQQTPEVVQALKIITVPGTEAIVRYGFEFARAYGRKKVTCMSKDNIMKHTDGLFHKMFDEIAKEYPEIQADHMIIDIGAARLAAKPENLDVIVSLNLYGDILSDIVAEVAGSVGIAGSYFIHRHNSVLQTHHPFSNLSQDLPTLVTSLPCSRLFTELPLILPERTSPTLLV